MDEKEYQPGVWYDADIQAPYNELCIVLCGNEMSFDNVFAGTRMYIEPPYYAKKAPSIVWSLTSPASVNFTVDDKDVKYWMLIPDVPEEV